MSKDKQVSWPGRAYAAFDQIGVVKSPEVAKADREFLDAIVKKVEEDRLTRAIGGA